MTTLHTRFDVAEYLVDDASIAAYLDACLEEGGVTLFQKAVGEVARARGMSEIASTTGVTRASLYKSLTEDGNPALSTMTRVIESFGLRFSIQPLSVEASNAEVRNRRGVRKIKLTDAPPRVRAATSRSQPLARVSAGSAKPGSRKIAMAAKNKSGPGSGADRSAKSDEFVAKGYAKKHPATTTAGHDRKASNRSK